MAYKGCGVSDGENRWWRQGGGRAKMKILYSSRGIFTEFFTRARLTLNSAR